MKFLEKDLEQIIYDANKELLAEKGLYIRGKLLRQLRVGNYGIADLVEFKRPYYHPYYKRTIKGEVIVYELKQDKIGISAFLQALGYLKGIKSFFENKGIEDNYHYSITLIGKEIDTASTFIYLTDFLQLDISESDIDSESKFTLLNYLYSYDIDGIKFNQIEGYDLLSKGF